jgi:hypothetical protein
LKEEGRRKKEEGRGKEEGRRILSCLLIKTYNLKLKTFIFSFPWR